MTLRLLAALWLLTTIMSSALAEPWKVSVNEREGLPQIVRGGAKVLQANYAFWADNWKWAEQHTQFKLDAPYSYSISGRNDSLNLDLVGYIGRPAENQLTWTFSFDGHGGSQNVTGGGIVFNFDLLASGRELGEPKLLSGNRGWSWGRPGQTQIEMRFDPPLAAIFFERGQKNQIRAYFYAGNVDAGSVKRTAVLTVSGDSEVVPTVGERFGSVDLAAWQPALLDWQTSPVDLSFLNEAEKPAGKHGFLRAAGDKLVFDDGTVARFWGTNIAGYALFGTSKENVRRQARRLSELGFNLVRLHHHDSPWVTPNIFGGADVRETRTLSSDMLDKLDWWIKCLKDEGIYVWLDLHVQRALAAGDGIDGFDEIRKEQQRADLKGYNFVNPSIQRAMRQFTEAYLNHGNNYTGLRYKDDPAIALMLISNENDVTHHFGNQLLPDKNVPWHNALFMNQARSFAAAWELPADKTWRSWEMGPSKLFLNDLERRFDAQMLDHLRGLKVRVPVITTSYWGLESLSSLPALTVGDAIDAHSYGGIGELEKNPLYAPKLTDWIAAAHVADKPLTVSEWNVGDFPAPDRHAVPLDFAATAAWQGWNAVIQYAYSQGPLNDAGRASNWLAYNDPGLLSTMPAAALLYRQGHVKEAGVTYVFAPGADRLYNQPITPANSAALRTAAAKGKLVIALPQTKELPWLKETAIPKGAQVISDPNFSLIPNGSAEASSDTGELLHNWQVGYYTVDTPRTQAAMGWIGGRIITLHDIAISTTTRNATVAVQALDGKPIASSSRLMISLGARAALKPPRNEIPFYSEPVEGQLTVAARKELKVYKKQMPGGALIQVPASYKDGRHVITLDRSLRTYWLFLR